jgi:PST family polysaccharide transporter
MIAALVVARTRVGRAMPAFDPDLWRELPRMALPLGGFLLVLNLYSYVDTVMLGVLATDAETGLYNFAYRIYEGLAYVPAVISTLIAPRLAREYVAHAGRYARLARQALAAGAALAAAAVVSIWLGGRWAVAFLFGPGFAGAVPMLWMLAGGLLFVFPIWILHAVAISADRERVLLRTTAVGVGLNVAANAVLIPRAGGTGAAAATVLAEAVTAALLFWQLRAPLGVAPDAGASGA